MLAVLALACSLAASSPGRGQVVPQRIAAVVNDDVITTRTCSTGSVWRIATSGLPNDDATRQRLAPQVLRGLIDEKLQLQEAKRLGIDVTDADLDQAMMTIAQRNQTTAPELPELPRRPRPQSARAARAAAGPDRLDQDRRPRDPPHIVVTQDQIDLALKRSAAGRRSTELQISEILLPVYDRAQEATVLDDAQGLVATLRGGASFAALARQVSAAASAAERRRSRLGAPQRRSFRTFATRSRRCRSARSPTRSSARRAYTSSWSATSARGSRRHRPTATAVRQRLEQEQIERQASRYLRDLRRDAFVDVRL